MHAHEIVINHRSKKRPRERPPAVTGLTSSAACSSHQDDNSIDSRRNLKSRCSPCRGIDTPGVIKSNAQHSFVSHANSGKKFPSAGSRETEPPAPLLPPTLPNRHPELMGTHTNVCISNPGLFSRQSSFVNCLASNHPT